MHLSSEMALDLIENRADEAQITYWTSHIAGCVGCNLQLNYWREMHVLLKRKHLENAPAALIQKAEAIFELNSQMSAAPKRRIMGLLLFDSFLQPAVAGVRGAAGTRQLVLRAEEFDIHVKILGVASEQRMTGQILARNTGAFVRGARLHLLRNGEEFEATDVDQFGGFEFSKVPEGILSIQIDLPHLTIVGALNTK